MIPQHPRRRAAAATVALATALAAAGAGAHDIPIVPSLVPTPPAKTVVPPPPALPTPLRTLLGQASAVVQGNVTRTEAFDDDRLHLHRIRVERVLHGQVASPEPGVVEIRGGSTRPPLLRAGEGVVLFVRPAAALSYLDAQLPAGERFELVGGRDGIVRLASDDEAGALAVAIQAILDTPAGSEADAWRNRRARAFAALDGRSSRLAADAVGELRAQPQLVPLDAGEIATVGRALHDPTLPPDVRASLIGLLGERQAREALPALAGATADTPVVLHALLDARRALGDVPTTDELAVWLESDDAGVRAVAVTGLAAVPGEASLRRMGRAASEDPDDGVRAAALDALGASGRADALPIVAGVFDGTNASLRNRAAQAVMAIGGDAADDTLVRLAREARSPDGRTYAAVVLIAMHGRQHPSVRRLEGAAPPEVQHVLEHGLEFGHRHGDAPPP